MVELHVKRRLWTKMFLWQILLFSSPNFIKFSCWFLVEAEFRFEFLIGKYACAENFKSIRQRNRPRWLKHVHGQQLLNFKVVMSRLVFINKLFLEKFFWGKTRRDMTTLKLRRCWPWTCFNQIGISLCRMDLKFSAHNLFSDEEFESEFRFY